MKQKIGVWGLGVVGKSAINYLYKQDYTITVTDKREPTKQELDFLQSHNAVFIPSNQIQNFLEHNDKIIASPGINVQAYHQFKHKWVTELDLFSKGWKKPIIAVTGTIGKTSVVHLLSKTLSQKYNYNVGGNIGTAMLDLIKTQANYEGCILELSSFQLENTTEFKADLAIWTNFYPNHLDRHTTLEEYFNAKLKLLLLQDKNQKAVVPWSLYTTLINHDQFKDRSIALFHETEPDLSLLRYQDSIYYNDGTHIIKYAQATKHKLIALSQLPEVSYFNNWLIITASLDLLTLEFPSFKQIAFTVPEHRLVEISTIDGITFYNDSKSTLMEATIAALKKFKDKRIHLFLGGLSKGVNRATFISDLKNKVVHTWCFGAEAQALTNYCKAQAIPSQEFASLEEAFKNCTHFLKEGDIVLFSPGGSSYDLFKDYKERGDCFIKLVKDYEKERML